VKSLAEVDPILRTERLVLRPLQPADAGPMWPFASDPEFPVMMIWEAHKDRAETDAFIAGTARDLAAGTSITWAMVEDGEFRGSMCLGGITHRRLAWRMDVAELGYWLGTPWHGRGLTTEAARAVLHFGFADLGLHKITVGCITENVASRRVIEKLGFRFIGERRDHMFRSGRWWSHLDYEMLADHWPGHGG
jgi:ribosomal-protein-alanine N-acetyltransferase